MADVIKIKDPKTISGTGSNDESLSEQLDTLFAKREFESEDAELENLIKIQALMDNPPPPQPSRSLLAEVVSGWFQIFRELFGPGRTDPPRPREQDKAKPPRSSSTPQP